MQKALKMLMIVGSLVLGTAYADTAGLDYAKKDNSNRYQDNFIVGLTVDHAIADGLAKGVTAEVRVEDQMITGTTPKRHEGLVQVKATRDLYTFTNSFAPVTFYGSGAVGLNSKSDSNFKYYVVAIGAKATFKDVTFNLADRLRSPFGEGRMGTGPKYRTTEQSLTVSYPLSKVYSVSAKYADEDGDSNYHTLGFGIKRTF